MATTSPTDVYSRGLLERFLSLLAPVKAGESSSALLLALNGFLLLSSYYVIKTIRDALILSEGGAEIKSYSSAAQALLLLLVVPAYGAFASKVNRSRLISWVTLFFISHLVLFYLAGQAGMKIGVVFFIWAGIFNVLVIAQFWSFANDLYTEEQGKRLFAIAGVGSSLGAWIGPIVAGLLFEDVGPYLLLLLSGVVLAFSIIVSKLAEKRAPRAAGAAPKGSGGEPLGKEGGFKLIFASRYLLLIAALIVLLNTVNTTGGFLLDKLVIFEADKLAAAGSEAANDEARRNFLGSFYGSFYGWVNLLSLLFQMFVVSRLFKYIGVRGALFVLPLIALGGYSLMLIAPVLAIVRGVKTLENATDYSIQNTARHALFLPTSREAKYKAKSAIDTFFWRAGDVLQAVIVFLGTGAGLAIGGFAALNLLFVALWLIVVVLIYREHRKLSPETT